MYPDSMSARALVAHREHTEYLLRRVRLDDSLDDREKGRRVTVVIAAANARLLAMTGRAPRALRSQAPAPATIQATGGCVILGRAVRPDS